MTKMKFVVYANCQSAALAETLLEDNEFSHNYEWDFISPVQNLSEKDIEIVISKTKNADLFIFQPISPAQNRPDELTTQYLLNFIKSDAKIISFPSIYFDGYFPHLQTLKGYISALNLVHDYFIAFSCSIGLNETETMNLIQKENLYPKNLSIELTENSLNNLKNKENESNIDIKLSSFITDKYKKEKLFNQFNHPRRPIFIYLCKQIFKLIGIENSCLDNNGKSYLDTIITPIYPSTYKNLNLEFNENFDVYNGLNGPGLKQFDIIKIFFNFYKQKDLEKIKSHICNVKPFIPQIVESHIGLRNL